MSVKICLMLFLKFHLYVSYVQTFNDHKHSSLLHFKFQRLHTNCVLYKQSALRVDMEKIADLNAIRIAKDIVMRRLETAKTASLDGKEIHVKNVMIRI